MPSSVCVDTWSLRQQWELLAKKWGSSYTHHNPTEGNSACHQTGILESEWTGCPWPQSYLYSRCVAVEENTALSSQLQVAIEDLSLLQALVALFPKWVVHVLLSQVSFNSTQLLPDSRQLSIAPGQAVFPLILQEPPYWLGSEVLMSRISHCTIHTLPITVS